MIMPYKLLHVFKISTRAKGRAFSDMQSLHGHSPCIDAWCPTTPFAKEGCGTQADCNESTSAAACSSRTEPGGFSQSHSFARHFTQIQIVLLRLRALSKALT